MKENNFVFFYTNSRLMEELERKTDQEATEQRGRKHHEQG